jgi:hypothetical protein
MNQSDGSSTNDDVHCISNGTRTTATMTSLLYNACPLIVIFLQFGITSMFMWMLCEGIHLNNVLTVSVFKNHFKCVYFYVIGWGKWTRRHTFVSSCAYCYCPVVPLVVTLSWTVVMFVNERDRKYVDVERHAHWDTFVRCLCWRCWANYNYLKYYWIIDGPRYFVMIVGSMFVRQRSYSFECFSRSRSISYFYWILFEYSSSR